MITALDKNTALVLIDLQEGIVGMQTAHFVQDILDKSVMLIDAFRKANLPIVIVNVNPVGAAWLKSRKDYNVVGGSANVSTPAVNFSKIVDKIKSQENDILITKKTWNAFFNTSLHEKLQENNVSGIVLSGISTSIGVEGTARAASELGYNISFAIDAMTDSKMDAHQNSIKNIFPRLGEVGDVADIIRKLH